jgi:SAM-dependent methyltransferase
MQTRTWNSLAELDPLWTVLTIPEKRFGRWNQDEFFATGEAEITKAFEICAMLGQPKERKVAVDFGCAVGRLSRALARRFERVIAIDVSKSMISLGRELNREISNLEFIVNETHALPIPDSSVDFVYSSIVLQHLESDERILAWISEFMRVLRPGGLLAFQLPDRLPLRHRFQGRRRVFAALSAFGFSPATLLKMGLAPIAMRGLSPRTVLQHLAPTPALLLQNWNWEKDFIYFVAKR